MSRIRDKMDRSMDEELLFELAVGFSISFAITVLLVLVVTPIHEMLHALGALIEGGSIKEIVWVDFQSWFRSYIHPVVATSGELGHTTASLPKNSLFGGFVFYFLPYIVLFPLSIVLMLGDNTRYLWGGDGLSNLWRILGGPIFILNFGAFWTDYALFMGMEGGVFPIPAVIWQTVYFGFIVMGVVGSTVVLYLLND